MLIGYETDDFILAPAGRKAELPQKFGIDAVTDDLLQIDNIQAERVKEGVESACSVMQAAGVRG